MVLKEPKPTYTGKLPEVSKIVIECDLRCCSKEFATAVASNPVDVIRSRAIEQFGLRSINLYGHRILKAGKENAIHQFIIKVSTDQRAAVLKASGHADLMARDFIPKGDQATDVSVLPRFFEISKGGREQARKIACEVTGFAGLAITRRGIAIRAWSSSIAELRRVVMAQDERLCELNMSTVPKYLFDSCGWPTAITPAEVTKAIHHAIKQAPVPTRCFKMLGLTSWTVAFQEQPTIGRFAAKFNDNVFEIILTPGGQNQVPNRKKDSKSKKNDLPQSSMTESAESREQSHDQKLNDRVALLENRFASLEKRTDGLENKLQTGFDHVNDQLRQVLAAVTSRASPHDQGLSPPPKIPKIG